MTLTSALIVAAGRGVRAGEGLPKQYRQVGGRPVLAWTLDAFLRHPSIGTVLVMIGPDDEALYAAAAPRHEKLLPPLPGGATRQESVRAGVESLEAAGAEGILIHDAVRPFVSSGTIDAVIEALGSHAAVLPALPVTDTLQRVSPAGLATGTVSREGLYAAETPQGFRLPEIAAAHARAAAEGLSFTDDATLAAWAGMEVKVVAGSRDNVKLTTTADLAAADARLQRARFDALPDIRVGTGYDVHPLGPGDAVTLGGLRIPHDRSLIGHSDADVVLHALTDALLGAIAEGDIGVHFPPSDSTWRGASSDRFLAFAADRVKARGGMIAHLDLALIAEEPKLAPHRDAMRQRIAEICGVSADRVAVKATTNERLGFVGRGEGIAAIATATVRLPLGSES